jgi:hypothetical protein
MIGKALQIAKLVFTTWLTFGLGECIGMPEIFEFSMGLFFTNLQLEIPRNRDFAPAGAGASQLKRYDGGFHNLLAEPKLKDQAEGAKVF